MLAIRAGYRTETLDNLSALAGVSAGLGLNVWGQELAYAWLPYGDLGDTHYVSLVMRLGHGPDAQKNLIQYQNIRTHSAADKDGPRPGGEIAPEEQQWMELLNGGERDAFGRINRPESR
ncbi:MAG: hypothetical protein A2992_04990 [Elusimicrobia bacterium RIFCSPLOWO2_01_FULL_59_12]|nr:MAG: hypothetical protein A2992_04990 [Elusimicrobia bacterium RIFCSPLOWO2_01_FULL_59_12]